MPKPPRICGKMVREKTDYGYRTDMCGKSIAPGQRKHEGDHIGQRHGLVFRDIQGKAQNTDLPGRGIIAAGSDTNRERLNPLTPAPEGEVA